MFEELDTLHTELFDEDESVESSEVDSVHWKQAVYNED